MSFIRDVFCLTLCWFEIPGGLTQNHPTCLCGREELTSVDMAVEL